MFHPKYEDMVRFASEGTLKDELPRAREEFVERTGAMFENHESYERRLASFLEWYVLDRPVSFATHLTPAKVYIDHLAPNLTTPELTDLRQLTRTVLSLFEFRGAKPEIMKVRNLLTHEKLNVFERRKPAGLEAGDILEARLVPRGDAWMFSETLSVHPRAARKQILAATKVHRKRGNPDERIDLIHRIAYLANRCEQYAHVDPKRIFADLLTPA